MFFYPERILCTEQEVTQSGVRYSVCRNGRDVIIDIRKFTDTNPTKAGITLTTNEFKQLNQYFVDMMIQISDYRKMLSDDAYNKTFETQRQLDAEQFSYMLRDES